MAIAIANSGAAHIMWHGNASPLTSGSVDTTGATCLILCLACDISSGTIAISDSKSNTWSLLSSKDNGFCRTHVWIATGTPTVGSGHTFTVTNGSFVRAQLTAYTGHGGHGTSDVVTSAPANQPGSNTPSATNELIILASGADNSVTGVASIDSGFTIIDQGGEVASDSYGLMVAYIVETSIVAKNPITAWTVSTAFSSTCVSISDSGGGGGGGGGATNRTFPTTSARSFPTTASRTFPVS